MKENIRRTVVNCWVGLLIVFALMVIFDQATLFEFGVSEFLLRVGVLLGVFMLNILVLQTILLRLGK